MIVEYSAMFSGRPTEIDLVAGGVFGLITLFFFVGPSSTDETVNVFLRSLAFLNAWFFLGSSGLIGFALFSPLLARVALPCAIWLLQIARDVLIVPQFLLDEFIEWMTESTYCCLRHDERYYAGILGSTSLESEDLKRCYKELLEKYDYDKLRHLGEEFLELADRRRKRIYKARRILLQENWIID